MNDVILTTKLRPPPGRAELPARPRLLARLDRGAEGRLTLVSAPAGYGKTTALAAWARHTELDAAWLALDANDNAPRRFLRHLVAALQRHDETLRELGDFVDADGDEVEDLQAALITVLNDVALNDRPLALVLDDLHSVGNDRVHGLLRFLLEHAPQQLRLVIGTRVDPPLPLARLRVAGQLTEIRAGELRLDAAEAAALLAALGAAPPEAVVAELVLRTEGWAAAIHLAGLSLAGRADPASFVRYFTGTDRFVLEYLTEEVLLRQPAEVQDFLLQSSVLERFDAGLAGEVTGEPRAGAMLERLERSNLFLVPLDERHETFRYHAFFQDLLQHRLLEARPDLAAELHRRAARALEARGDLDAALPHAWLSGDPAFAAARLDAHPRHEAGRAVLREPLSEPERGGDSEALLAALMGRGGADAVWVRVLAALEDDEPPAADAAQQAARRAGLDPLSERELEVLRLIAVGLSNKHIARRLDISLNTVKTHARNAYGKLAVSSRTEAAARARELGLV
ncbi:MAG TPA: LuxR C-terminal-related transcriptional regulator [Trueperaceae bacterium]|nr:LuxR C-terminal-related transcriptional regulator [Trueperaceae bacterium]